MKSLFIVFICLACALRAEPVQVVVSIPPQKWLVETLYGDDVNVTVLLRPGDSPHTFSPAPSEIRALAKADYWLRIGVTFEEALVSKIKDAQSLKIVDLSKGFPKRAFAGCEDHDHQHQHDHGHDHHTPYGGIDPHMWLCHEGMRHLALRLQDTLAIPQTFDRDIFRFLDVSKQEITARFESYEGRTFYVFHPSYGYFADEFGLKQVAIESGGKKPSGRQLRRIIYDCKKLGIKTIFVQPQFDNRTAAVIARAIDGEVVALDPLAENWQENMKSIADSLSEAFDRENAAK